MHAQDITNQGAGRDYTVWDRRDSTRLVYEFEWERARLGTSQRSFAQEHGVPRTTLQHWLERKATLDCEAELVAFLESPVGLAFLHRQVLLLHLVFCQAGPCGVDRLCTYLRLSGLDPFVASSHGEQHAVATDMRSEILAYEQAQRAKQAPGMRRRDIAMAADETFHPEICLVGIEPDSNFILVLQYVEKREAAIRSLSTAYHPFDLQTGRLRTADTIAAEFDQAVATIDETVETLRLSGNRREKVNKAKRVLPKMIALVAFFYSHLRRRLTGLGVSEAVVEIVLQTLVPAFYLEQVARRRCSAAERDRRLALSRDLLARARDRGSAFAALPGEIQSHIELLANDCAALFVRATA